MIHLPMMLAKILRSCRAAGLTAWMLAISVCSLPAQSTWIGGSGGQWGSAGNWSPAGVPNAVDGAVNWTNGLQPYLTTGSPFTNGAINVFYGGGSLAFGSDTANDKLVAQVSAGSPTIYVTNGGNVYFYVVLSGTQGFCKTGAGTLTFRYNSQTQPYAGTVSILGGTLGIQADYSLGNTNNNLVITNAACLTAASSANGGIFWLAPSRTITLAGTQAQIAVNSAAYTLVVPGLINENPAGSGLLWSSAGSLVLSNANTFTGPLTVAAGTNDLANVNAAQFATVTINGGVLQFDQAVSGRGFAIGGLAGTTAGVNVVLQNNAATPAAITLTVGGNNSSNTFAGNLTGAGSLIKAGAGSTALLGTNTYAGTTTINAGRLAISAASIIPGAVMVADGATNCVAVMRLGQTLANGSLTLGDSAGATMEFNNQVPANPAVPMLSASNLTIKGNVKINLTGAAFAYYVGTIPLLAYGAKSGGGTWVLNAMPAGMTASLVDTGSLLQLVITAVSNSVVNATVSCSATNAGFPINPAFCGFSYEKAQLSGSLFTSNDVSLQGMLGRLGAGVLRIGAASVNSTCWNGVSNCPPITPAQVDSLAGFVNALPANWSVIYAVNQVSNTAANAAAEAAYAANALGSRLLGFEIGNEPDLYHDYYRTNTYSYANFLAEWQPFAVALTNSVPGWAATNHGVGWTLSGPATSWNVAGYTLPFVTNEAKVIAMATHHYYRDSATSTNATMPELLKLDAGLAVDVSNLVAAAGHFNLPQGFRMDESGSFSGGGNTNSAQYGSALWAVDVLFTIAVNGGQGINFHSGGNGTSSYTPIADNGTGVVSARPEYYALKLFSLAAHGSALPAIISPAPAINFAAYGIRYTNGALGMVLNNKDTNNAVQVTVNLGTNVAAAQALVLTGPSLNSTSGYALGGATINPDGTWSGGFQPAIAATNGQLTYTVLPLSAVWLNPLLPPVLAPLTNRTLIAGANLSVTNQASDPNVPAQTLGFALPVKPTGAAINGANGGLSWRPPVAAGGTSNRFQVVVTNTSGLAATQGFWALVLAPQKPDVSTPDFAAGHYTFAINGNAGPDYIIQGTTNLASPAWQSLSTNQTPTPPFQWTDTNTPRAQFYYRVLLGP